MARKKRTDSDDISPMEDAGLLAGEELMAVPEEEFVGPPAPVSHAPVPEEAFVGPPLPELPPPELLPTQPMLPPAPPPPLAVVAQPPMAQAPVAHLAYISAPEMEERLRRLEQTLAQIKEVEQRLAAHSSAGPASVETQPVKNEASSLLAGAASLLEVGRLLLPAALAGPGQPPTPGSLADLLADLRAMYRMLVDPRYGMSWLGRLGIPGFLLLFLFPSLWMPASGLIENLSKWALWMYHSLGQLVTAFALFRVATFEARRYRETAPDLPPSLRL